MTSLLTLNQAFIQVYARQNQGIVSVGQDTSQTAKLRTLTHASDYARTSAPRSPNPALTGNKVPNHSQLQWLKGHPKCNQFVGDIFYLQGKEFPSFRMPDGSYHYVHAEQLLKETEYFSKIPKLQIQAGDLHLIDYPGKSGSGGGAHVEIVVSVQGSNFEVIGAGEKGLYQVQKNLQTVPGYSSFLRHR